jgi:hypothetical protein
MSDDERDEFDDLARRAQRRPVGEVLDGLKTFGAEVFVVGEMVNVAYGGAASRGGPLPPPRPLLDELRRYTAGEVFDELARRAGH